LALQSGCRGHQRDARSAVGKGLGNAPLEQP